MSDIPYDWDGPVSYLGSLPEQPEEIADPIEEETPEETSSEGFVQEELDLDLPEPTSQVPVIDQPASEEPAAETSEAKDN